MDLDEDGLKQAGLLANIRQHKDLAKYGYLHTPCTPGLWKHATRNITFSLVVDRFRVTHVSAGHVEDLVHVLRSHGINTNAMSIYSCQGTSLRHSTNSSTTFHCDPAMPPTPGTSQPTVPKSSMHQILAPYQSLAILKSQKSNRSLALSSTTASPSIQRC
jgi:hypothetical protein